MRRDEVEVGREYAVVVRGRRPERNGFTWAARARVVEKDLPVDVGRYSRRHTRDVGVSIVWLENLERGYYFPRIKAGEHKVLPDSGAVYMPWEEYEPLRTAELERLRIRNEREARDNAWEETFAERLIALGLVPNFPPEALARDAPKDTPPTPDPDFLLRYGWQREAAEFDSMTTKGVQKLLTLAEGMMVQPKSGDVSSA